MSVLERPYSCTHVLYSKTLKNFQKTAGETSVIGPSTSPRTVPKIFRVAISQNSFWTYIS